MVQCWWFGGGWLVTWQWRETKTERKKGKREKSNLYYFIGLYVKIRNEMLGVLLNALVK